jgi:hypothetical protein
MHNGCISGVTMRSPMYTKAALADPKSTLIAHEPAPTLGERLTAAQARNEEVVHNKPFLQRRVFPPLFFGSTN